MPPQLIFGGLAVLSVLGFVGVAFSPYLAVNAPLGLIALSPLVRHLVVVSPSLDPVPFFLVATVRLFLIDPFMYALGERYGPRAITWFEAREPASVGLARRVERIFKRAGALVVLVWPGPMVCAVAGVFRMPYLRFVILNLIGTLCLVTLVRIVGEAFRTEILAFQDWIDANLSKATAVTVILAVAGWMAWRKQAQGRLEEIEPRDDG